MDDKIRDDKPGSGGTIPVTRATLPPMEEFTGELAPLWESRILTNMGALHARLEAGLRPLAGDGDLVLFSSGHAALEAALRSLRLPAGSEVVTSPFTFPSTAWAVLRTGLVPVFCDVLPGDGTLDPSSMEPILTERTGAILPVHVYGRPCRTDEIGRIASARGIPVVYDAAHTFGVEHRGRPLASYGDLSVLSFHATKVFSTVEGGAVCCHSTQAARFLRDDRNFGIRDEDSVEWTGGNGKLSELHCAMGLCNLRRFESERDLRRTCDSTYREALSGLQAEGRLEIPSYDRETLPNYGYFPVLAPCGEATERAYSALLRSGIHPRRYFHPLVTDTGAWRAHAPGSRPQAPTPVARDLARRVLCLPIYPGLGEADILRACGILRTVL